MSNCRGEFVFILDRSGSMDGSRIENARNALIFFLKSLPIDSIFNVISFGDHHYPMYSQSQKNEK